MTEWTLLKRLLDAVHQHSTMIGRLWLTVMVIFRLLVVAVATEDVYTDEQEMFVCNTLQPGCSTVCYDAFAPISQPRFWVFHIISVSTPSLCFIIYTWHNLSKVHSAAQRPPRGAGQPLGQDVGQAAKEVLGKEAGKAGGEREVYPPSCSSDSCSVLSHKHLGHSLVDILDGVAARSLRNGDPATSRPIQAYTFKGGSSEGLAVSGGVLSKCYILHVCLRAALEVGFVAAQWRLFGLQVPVRFLCTSSPCNQPVDCYVSRPTEKTIFLIFMFCVGVFCIFLNLLELNHLGWKKIRQAVRPKEDEAPWQACAGIGRGYQTIPPVSPSPKSSGTNGTAPPPTLDVAMGHKPEWGCAVNCGGTRGCGKVKGERKHKELRGLKQSSAEVWI